MKNDFGPLNQAVRSFYDPVEQNVMQINLTGMSEEDIQKIKDRFSKILHGGLEEYTPPEQHEDLYAVEELSTSRNIYLVRACSSQEAIDRVETEGENFEFLQAYIGSHYPTVWNVITDNDIVGLYRITEDANMTLEKFGQSCNRDRLLENLINE